MAKSRVDGERRRTEADWFSTVRRYLQQIEGEKRKQREKVEAQTTNQAQAPHLFANIVVDALTQQWRFVAGWLVRLTPTCRPTVRAEKMSFFARFGLKMAAGVAGLAVATASVTSAVNAKVSSRFGQA